LGYFLRWIYLSLLRQAADFIMTLQLSGAAKADSLTGIDTATEVQAYYLVQIKKNRLLIKVIIKKLQRH
jgi:hypothetical protein